MKPSMSASLSVIMPIFNEQFTLRTIVRKVLEQEKTPEISSIQLIIVDDCSTDDSPKIIKELAKDHPQILPIFHKHNQGKTAAINSGIELATGELAIFQDGDLEYDPHEYSRLMKPILAGDADVVYGSRFLVSEYRRILYFWHSLLNFFLTNLSNVFNDLNLSDMETCYKMFRTNLLKSIPIRSKGFGLEPEITAKIAKRGFRVYEVPICYRGRTYEEGKKITWKDGLWAIYYIIKFWLIDDCYKDFGEHQTLFAMSQAPRFNKWMGDVVRPFVGKKVLEIGAGIGNVTSQFLPREEYIASDIDKDHLDTLKSRFGKQEKATILKLDLSKPDDFDEIAGKIDSVICLNVLEHVQDDVQALKTIFKTIQPGGNAIILVPQNPSLFGSLDKIVCHYRRFSKKDLEQKMVGAGFAVQTIFDFNRPGVIGWFLNGKVFKNSSLSKIQLKIFDHLVWLFRLIDDFLPWHGLSVIAVGKKRTE